LGLQSLRSDVTYAATTLADSDHTYSLPQSAVIEANTVRQHWRNVHHFDTYRKFQVDTKLKLGDPE
jgi:hypothetical protein